MARELGGSQISALLESVPGIVNVLRNPVADALVGMIRAGAGVEEFSHEYASELVQYAVRRGLIQSGEGERVLADVQAAVPKGRSRKSPPAAKRKPTPPARAKPPATKQQAKPPATRRTPVGRPARKSAGRPSGGAAKKSTTGRPVKKSAKRARRR
jgi:pyruvate/2-oxoglutarate dehydrogenase complex dihydrolipoamide acyltransferase (E2) component